MCLIFVAMQQHSKWSLILASNRDEFFHRPSQPGHFWAGQCNLLGGQDQEKGGTWLAINRQGKIAAVTNFRAPNQPQDKNSRGLLVRDYLVGSQTPGDYISSLPVQDYNGYNLLLGDAKQLFYTSNQTPNPKKLQPLTAGVYGLSNHLLDTPWPKVETGKKAFAKVIAQQDFSIDQLFTVMCDATQAADQQLPDTGIGQATEKILSSRFIPGRPVGPAEQNWYGTRTTTVVLMEANGNGVWFERNHSLDKINDTETLAFRW